MNCELVCVVLWLVCSVPQYIFNIYSVLYTILRIGSCLYVVLVFNIVSICFILLCFKCLNACLQSSFPLGGIIHIDLTWLAI